MPEEIDGSITTFEGNRKRQHEEFRALSFRQKLMRVEQMAVVVEYFLSRRDRNRGQGTTDARVAP
jgi:hypothetical protein